MKRFPHFTQLNAFDCGPTCLRMIAKHYGIDYSPEMLRRHCHISNNGVNMRGISEGAQYIGFETVGLKLTFLQLLKEGVFPCILHWNQNHFVVCYGVNRGRGGKYKVLISDPASQRLTYTKEEFLRCWVGHDAKEDGQGMVLMQEPSDNWCTVEDEYRRNSLSMLSFAKYFTPYSSMIGQLMLAMLVGSVVG